MSGTWKDLVSHAKAEEKTFKQRATNARKERIIANKERRWLDALTWSGREMEYRNSASQRRSFINQNKGKL